MAERLPIYDLEPALAARLREERRFLISAPTGSGKSTQIPQMLLRHGALERGQAVVLQPRRLAARMLAARVAQELGVSLGQEVGYQVRLEGAVGPRTRIRFVTEGILLRQMVDDPSLRGVSALVFDEFHERHLYGDVTLARALDLQETTRPDLKLFVMSATLDVERLDAYLKPCARLSSEGRTFPVRISHRAPRSAEEPPWEQAADAVAVWAADGGEGDVLVFMPGAYEIHRTIEALREREAARGAVLLPLHGELPPGDQDAAVARHERRKIVVATNVAETSVTIDGVRLVVDSGLARMARHDPQRGINTLFVEKISRASADQRAGRAGRTAPGDCIRLWPERETRPARELPEVRRLDLAETVLTLKAGGTADVRAFRWLDAPDEKAVAHAEALLEDLGATDGGAVTPLGRRMLAFPLHPRHARLLLAAHEHGCVREAALVAALLQGRELLLRRVDGDTSEFRELRFGDRASSDFRYLMAAWRWAAERDFRMDACRRAGIHAVTARQVGPLADQILRIAGREGLDVSERPAADEPLRKALLTAFADRVSRRLDEGTLRCAVVHGGKGVLARESLVRHAEFFVPAEIREVEARGEVQTILSLATAVEPAWIREQFPDAIGTRTAVEFDPAAKRVVAEAQVCYRDLALESRRVEPPPAEEAARLLAGEVLAGRLELKGWDAATEQWVHRMNLLARVCPELGIPPFGEAERRAVIEDLCHGATAWKEIRERPVLPAVRGWLSPAQQALVEKHAPERVALPGGRSPKVTYAA
ncbi:MAG TPA: helicase-related protein, partial [Planctomycetota bacterium]|nr:helicase-related protein [Planctomycetota bacterium]